MNTNKIGEGHGIEGRYGGLPDPYGALESAAIVLLPVPFDKTTTYSHGTDKGPSALIEASRHLELYDIETNAEVYLKGIHTAAPIEASSSEEMLEKSYEATKSFLDQGKFVVVVGGEHSISYAPIKAHLEKYPSLTVLQLDAHADLHPAYENNRWSHASAMARVKELGIKIVSVGIRSMSSVELINVDLPNTFYAHELTNNWIEEVIARLSGPIYITFDLDAFDPALMPSTGTPEPGGLFWNETMQLLKRVMKEKKVVGLDVVELCPNANNAAPDFLAAKLIYKMLSYKFN